LTKIFLEEINLLPDFFVSDIHCYHVLHRNYETVTRLKSSFKGVGRKISQLTVVFVFTCNVPRLGRARYVTLPRDINKDLSNFGDSLQNQHVSNIFVCLLYAVVGITNKNTNDFST